MDGTDKIFRALILHSPIFFHLSNSLNWTIKLGCYCEGKHGSSPVAGPKGPINTATNHAALLMHAHHSESVSADWWKPLYLSSQVSFT